MSPLTLIEEGKAAKIELSYAINWIADAWANVSEVTIANVWSRAGVVPLPETTPEVAEFAQTNVDYSDKIASS